MTAPALHPEISPNPVQRVLRGTTRRALTTVTPLTPRERDAKRVGAFARLSSLWMGLIERDLTGESLTRILAGIDSLKLALVSHAASYHGAHGNTAAHENALYEWRALRPD